MKRRSTRNVKKKPQADSAGSEQEPEGKNQKVQEQEEEQESLSPQSIITNSNENNPHELEVLEDGDDRDEISELVIGQSINPEFILERILALKSHSFDELVALNFPGLDSKYNAASQKNEDKLKGLLILETVKLIENLLINQEFATYREVFYDVNASLPALKKYVAKTWLQFRPIIRYFERTLKIPRFSFPISGRPNGFIALGELVKLLIEGKNVGIPGDRSKLPFGNDNIDGLGPFTTNAVQIIIVESHAEFKNLISGGVLSKAKNSIIIGGSGNPDLGLRATVSKLAFDTKLPVKSLVDCDLRGFMIAAQYAFGSYSYDFKDNHKFLTPQLSPIGLLPADILPTDRYFSDMSTAEIDQIQMLRNKWTSHDIHLSEKQTFWEEIAVGFEEMGKKMSLAQIRKNRGRSFHIIQIYISELQEMCKNCNVDLSRVS